VRVEAVPLDVNNYRVVYQPRVLTGTTAEEVIRDINSISEKFRARLDLRNGRGVLEPTPAPGN
jgi:hypothetical protein